MMDVARIMSEQEVALSHGQDLCGLADQQFAVGANVIGFGIDLDDGRGVVQDHVLLADAAAHVLDGDELLLDAELRRPAHSPIAAFDTKVSEVEVTAPGR